MTHQPKVIYRKRSIRKSCRVRVNHPRAELEPYRTPIPNYRERSKSETLRLADDQMSDEHLGLVWG